VYIGLDFFLWDVAQPKSGPFNNLVMLKNTHIFAKSYNFEGSFSHLHVGYLWVQPEINIQCLLAVEIKLKNERIFTKSDDF
jgi:hypothetical protein